MNDSFPAHITNGEKYDPAMQVQTVGQAYAWLEKCIEHSTRNGVNTRQQAQRVYSLYGVKHPVFGLDTPSSEEALKAGMALVKGQISITIT